MFKLANKTAIITGGASGIGLAISRLFAEKGAFVHILELNIDAAEREADLIIAAGGNAKAHAVDLSKQNDVLSIINKIAKEHQIDILINNAGVAHVGNVEKTSETDFDRIMNANVKGVYNCLYAVIPYMKNSGGVIINMASVAATVAVSDRFAYSASKGAIISMTFSVAKDYIHHNIRCNSISPARIHTPFVDGFVAKNYPDNKEEIYESLSKSQPIGRMGKPNEVAALALYLCSDEASFITGTDYPIDGGFIRLNS